MLTSLTLVQAAMLGLEMTLHGLVQCPLPFKPQLNPTFISLSLSCLMRKQPRLPHITLCLCCTSRPASLRLLFREGVCQPLCP